MVAVELNTKKAYDLFIKGAYKEALEIYQSLNKAIGGDLFLFNINKCKKEILSKGKIFNIAYISDLNYLMPTYVSLFSLRKNRNPNNIYRIYVILNCVESKFASILKSLEVDGFEIIISHFNEERDDFSIKKNGFHVSTSAVLKFNLPKILKDLNEVLYIDGDTIINKDLSDLFSISLDGFYAAVVEDVKPKIVYKPSILDRLKISDHKGYFNSGVLFLNLKKMREDGISEKLFDYRKNGVNFFMDQDALNVVFNDKTKFLSCTKNFLVTLEESFSVDEIKKLYGGINKFNNYRELVEYSDIVHFASKNKPWIRSGVKHSDVWYGYYLESGAALMDFSVNHNVAKIYPKDIVVSLTSWPGRISIVHETIERIKGQSIKPGKIILWLANEQFKNKEKDLPSSLLKLRSDLFEIRWCNDIRSYKKLIPSIRDFRNCVIVTADDDILYERDWLFGLVKSYLEDPEAIHCYRAHEISFDKNWNPKPYKTWKRDVLKEEKSYFNFFTGCGGVLYPSKSLYHHVVREDLFQNTCPTGDDIWFWGMAVLNGTKIKIVGNKKFNLSFVPSSQDNALWQENDAGGKNDVMINNIFNLYPGIIKELQVEKGFSVN